MRPLPKEIKRYDSTKDTKSTGTQDMKITSQNFKHLKRFNHASLATNETVINDTM